MSRNRELPKLSRFVPFDAFFINTLAKPENKALGGGEVGRVKEEVSRFQWAVGREESEEAEFVIVISLLKQSCHLLRGPTGSRQEVKVMQPIGPELPRGAKGGL
jgi:hypothetical protein